MELQYIDEDNEKTLERFLRSQPDFDFQSLETVSIVGNSGKVMDEKWGTQIDNSDCIVRFNAAPTENYETHVGSRTDFRVLNGPIMIGGSVDYVSTPRNWISTLEDERLILMPHNRKYKEKHFETAKDLAGDKNEIIIAKRKINEWAKEVGSNWGVMKPSTGLKTILLFLCLADRLDLYGFGFHQERNLKKRHYWEEFDYNSGGGHRWVHEKRMVHKLKHKYNIHLR